MGKKSWTDKENFTNKNAGFSLIEVILAMAILAIISIPLMNYFTDSMRYSAQTAKRQKATALAQQVTEEMKAQSRLIRREPLADGTDGYQAPLLTAGEAEGGYGLSMVSAGPDFRTQGKGEAVFEGEVEFAGISYDLKVTLLTEEAAAQQQTMTYGVNDATDVMAIQRDQQAEAAVYFMAAQRDDSVKNGGVPWTYEQTLAKMSRRAYIDVGWEAGNKNFTVKIWYEYSCPEAHAPSASYRGTYLADARVDSLRNIYLLYEKNGGENRDYVNVKVSADAKNALDLAGLSMPALHLICQKPAEDLGYQLVVDQTGSAQRFSFVRSNIRMAERTGKVTELSGGAESDMLTEPPASIGEKPRIVEITTEVYAAGRGAQERALAQMKASKSE